MKFSECYAIDRFGTYFTHIHTCDSVRVQSATQSTASVHTWSKPVITFVFKVLRHAIDCFGTYPIHMSKPVITFVFKVLRNRVLRYILYTCPNLWYNVRVPSATQPTASVHTLHMSKPVITFVFKVLRHAIDCFGTYSTHVQTCDNVRVQSATQSSASAHTLHMSKPVITFVFKVLRNRVLR